MKSLTGDALSIDGLKVVVQKMGDVDIDGLIKAATLLSEKDYIAILGGQRQAGGGCRQERS